jgi:16S rRNA (uracil1498-N3)-methyltransferase
VVEKATEIGVSKILPVITSRTFIKNINNERLNLIAKEAAEQSEALDVPLVEALQKLEKLLETWDKNRKLFCCFERNNEHNAIMKMADYFKSFGKNAPCGVLIGPEGGFSEAEMQFLRKLDFVCEINLGKKILRAETAAIAALSLVSACMEA